MIKVKLNNAEFNYDVYQIINLFFLFPDIKFVEENYDFNIEVKEDMVVIQKGFESFEYTINKLYKLKEEVKKAVFLYFSKDTTRELPWGTLIGIRPSKRALELLQKDISEKDIIAEFKEKHITREDKARLCIDVAKFEKNIVNKEKDNISVYIGMPFCPTRCLYCSFASNPISSCKNIVEPYLEALSHEIKEISDYVKGKKLNIECVYFGGGTPTSVNDEQFEFIMKCIYEAFIQNDNVSEFTVECGRPDSITFEKLTTMKKYGVHRISINPQTMNDDTLELIGRTHSVNSVNEKFAMARELGFDNINMDLIVGLPGEKISHIIRTCDKISQMKPDSITIHGMSIKRASKLHENMLNNYRFQVPAQEELNQMYEHTVELSKKLHMKPYYMYRQKNMVGNMENIGYTTPGKEGIYNIQMIEEKQTVIALGADAVCKVVFLEENRHERFANIKDVREYVKRVDEMIDKKIELLNTLYN
ncbi:coproporphyrinogen III oxidase [Clostridium sp. CF011]|uniref:coproporphyrinogen III oxidase n=1 Tax=unclassified Clostridium TaxID=2614128 RepID=UPI001C0D5BC2|nr:MULTISPECIES: coproporphyrinogen III oxidase [unclassified Clostridium]MBU3091911.1 coproporphyrinogen III oxidase [Clostridium sp. CF011]MBW9145718.1 coproporphyrinogen III oxidase [Clostridium sp. CM027]UVE41433.1 coproporphyrinogen III oxidase [Clostridium sp. CM027]WAG70427.1 coproporphyrinogen III oxidase [Clostridium sp. CF011]